MTRFEKYAANIDSVADLVILASNLDLGQQYCKKSPECVALLDTDEISESECRKCLVEWLNEEQEGDTQ